jgi:hypothetical protein
MSRLGYVELSATPEHFKTLVEDVSPMGRTQLNYSAYDLGKIRVPVVIVQSKPQRCEPLRSATES